MKGNYMQVMQCAERRSTIQNSNIYIFFHSQKCVGFVFLWHRIGSILNALMSPGSGLSLATMICYCSGPIIGGLFCLFLPETSNMPLPDTLEGCQKQPVLPFFYKR